VAFVSLPRPPSRILLAAFVLAACSGPPPAPAQTGPAPADPATPAPAPAPAKKYGDGDWSFDFKDAPPGPRAPTYTAFGVTVGTTRFPDVEKLVRERGLECGDTSIRAMMDRRREKEKARIDEAKAKGEDAVTAASWVNRRSKREANPQVRFSCPKIPSTAVGDRTRPPSTGRLLFVFDSPDYPLRHTSFQRTHADHAAALTDFNDTVASLTKVYGQPTKPLNHPLPTPGKDGKVEFPGAVNHEISWEYSDLLVRANVLRYGNMITIGERIEVPHGIRPDAPQLGAGQPAAAPPPTDPKPTDTATAQPTDAKPTDPKPTAKPTPTKSPEPTPAR
jgi:hypothetical protein